MAAVLRRASVYPTPVTIAIQETTQPGSFRPVTLVKRVLEAAADWAYVYPYESGWGGKRSWWPQGASWWPAKVLWKGSEKGPGRNHSPLRASLERALYKRTRVSTEEFLESGCETKSAVDDLSSEARLLNACIRESALDDCEWMSTEERWESARERKSTTEDRSLTVEEDERMLVSMSRVDVDKLLRTDKAVCKDALEEGGRLFLGGVSSERPFREGSASRSALISVEGGRPDLRWELDWFRRSGSS